MKKKLAFLLLLIIMAFHTQAQTTLVFGPAGSSQFGQSSTILTNGNYVITDPGWDGNKGAVYLYNGATHARISTLVGTQANDYVGNGGVTALSNGNYVVRSSNWKNGSNASAGAVTWGNGTTGTSGTVSASNSLVGTQANDQVGNGDVTALSNGNYVVSSFYWNNGSTASAGAVTWGNGTTGTSGTVSASNSLVGTQAGDYVGNGDVTALSNGNYVVRSSNWKNGSTTNAGAVTWGNGTTGTSGTVSASNSLVGTQAGDQVGNGGVTALSNGNYVVRSFYWKNGSTANAGAVTWGNGTTGTSGAVNTCNSILGGVQDGYFGNTAFYSTTYDYLLAGKPSENAYAIFKPGYQGLAGNGYQETQTIAGNPVIFGASCAMTATITPSGSAPVSGVVTVKAYVQDTSPAYNSSAYVRRHYDIQPVTNPNAATANLTFYFSQADFDDYNAANGTDPDLPTGPSDAAGISNLRITQHHGTSTTGLPGTYTGYTGTDSANVLITPTSVFWNSTDSRWEVTFPVTGFSGFFVHGNVNNAPLPVILASFNARVVGESNVLVNWLATNTQQDKEYLVERSADGKTFSPIGSVTPTIGTDYRLHDYEPLMGKSYYRLRITGINGQVTYSEIRSVVLDISGNVPTVRLYPSPAKDYVIIARGDGKEISGVITDMQGRILLPVAVQSGGKVNIASLAGGVYLLRTAEGQTFKVIKE